MNNIVRVSCRYTCSKLLRNTYSHVSDDTTYGKFKLWLQVIGGTNGKYKQDTDDFPTTPDYLSICEMETSQPPAEFSFKAGYSQALSIWCFCFVMLSAFKAVIGSISYINFNLAIEAIFIWVQWFWECSIFAKKQLVKAVKTKEHLSSFHLPCEILVRLIRVKEGWILS